MKKKILIFVESIYGSGAGLAEYVKILVDTLNTDFIFFILTYSSKEEEPIVNKSVDIIYLDKSVFKYLSNKNKIYLLLKNNKFDIIHINGIWRPEQLPLLIASKKNHIKTVISIHGMLENYILRRNLVKKYFAWILYQKKCLNTCNVIHATCKQEQSSIKKLLIKTNIVLIENFINLTSIPIMRNKQITKNVLFLSRIHQKKGIEELIEAWDLISDKNNYTLQIYGGGEKSYIKKIKNKIEHCSSKNSIMYNGPISSTEKWFVYHAASFFILPTYSENFGLVIAESLACGTPVLTTKNAPWDELEEYGCGFSILLTINNLRKSLETIIFLPDDKIIEMGVNGKRLIEKKYSTTVVSPKIVKMYNSLIK